MRYSAEVELRTDLKVSDYKSNPTLAWRTKVGGTDGPFEREAHDEYALTLVTSMLRWVRSLLGRAVSDLVRGVPARLRLRTKLLFSFVLMTTCLTSITLLVLRREAQGQVQHRSSKTRGTPSLHFRPCSGSSNRRWHARQTCWPRWHSSGTERDGDYGRGRRSVAIGRLQFVCAGREGRRHRGIALDGFVAVHSGSNSSLAFHQAGGNRGVVVHRRKFVPGGAATFLRRAPARKRRILRARWRSAA